jgi:Spy/CpxP family protein refolding chaperone
MNAIRISLAALAVGSLLVCSLSAQERGGPPGGRGGFRNGGGFLPRGGAGEGALGLVAIEEVQKELALSAEQRPKIEALREELQVAMQSAMEELDPRAMEELEPAERERRMAEMRGKMEAVGVGFDARLGALLDEKQNARLAELRLQREGAAALLRAELASKLGLSAEQVEKLRALRDEAGPFRPLPEEALRILTPEQSANLDAMKGASFAFPARPRGPGGMGGPGGPGGMGGPDRKLAKKFDANDDGVLDAEERALARAEAKKEVRGGFGGRGGPGGRGGRGGGEEAAPREPGPKLSPSEVAPLQGPLYDPKLLRTLFLDFESADWEAEMADFYRTDVEVPATLTVDGRSYPEVGVGFRGMSSFMMLSPGSKRSLNLSLDAVKGKQRLQGYRALNLLNAHSDPSFLHSILYSHIARQYIPAPKANLVKLVINGESWGLYVNVQQFDQEFLAENYPSTAGTRWKVPGSPNGDGGLRYLGEEIAPYKERYDRKNGSGEGAWRALIRLCRTLEQTPPEELEAALAPMLDLDEALWFLALDVALVNGDGYWTRASDYSLFLDSANRFHLVAHDFNEIFGPGGGGPGGGGPGMGGGRGGGGGGSSVTLDPLVGLNDAKKPLRSKLLAVPALRKRYLQRVRTIAEHSLDWAKLEPLVSQYRALLEPELRLDTRKLSSMEAFERALDPQPIDPQASLPRGGMSLRAFADRRRAFLLGCEAIRGLDEPRQPNEGGK